MSVTVCHSAVMLTRPAAKKRTSVAVVQWMDPPSVVVGSYKKYRKLKKIIESIKLKKSLTYKKGKD